MSTTKSKQDLDNLINKIIRNHEYLVLPLLIENLAEKSKPYRDGKFLIVPRLATVLDKQIIDKLHNLLASHFYLYSQKPSRAKTLINSLLRISDNVTEFFPAYTQNEANTRTSAMEILVENLFKQAEKYYKLKTTPSYLKEDSDYSSH